MKITTRPHLQRSSSLLMISHRFFSASANFARVDLHTRHLKVGNDPLRSQTGSEIDWQLWSLPAHYFSRFITTVYATHTYQHTSLKHSTPKSPCPAYPAHPISILTSPNTIPAPSPPLLHSTSIPTSPSVFPPVPNNTLRSEYFSVSGSNSNNFSPHHVTLHLQFPLSPCRLHNVTV